MNGPAWRGSQKRRAWQKFLPAAQALPKFTTPPKIGSKTVIRGFDPTLRQELFSPAESKKGLTRESDSLIKLRSQSGSHFDWFFSPE